MIDGVGKPIGPSQVYAERRTHWERKSAAAEKAFVTLGNWRLSVAVLAAITAYLIWGRALVPAWVIGVPVLVFVGLAFKHNSVIRERTLAARALSFYDQSLNRLRDEWSGRGETGDRYKPGSAHVYADDLDLFGRGSLFQLLSRARTSAGEQRLAEWLSKPSPRSEAMLRQAAVQELSTRVELREDIVLLGEDVRSNIQESDITAWADRPARHDQRLRWIALFLGVTGIAALIGFLASAIPFLVFAFSVALNMLFSFLLRRRVAAFVEGVGTPANDLKLLSLLLRRLEQESFDSVRGRYLHSLLVVEGEPASKRIRSLSRWIDVLDSRDHLLVRALQPFSLWREQAALGIEHWRANNRAYVANWLSAVAEFEALSSLATLAFERPDWIFPSLVESKTAVFSARAIRHPLLPSARSIPNHIAFDPPLRLWIISGSNMSGKSTLLRAIGLNTVLAWAGAPVPAARLELSELQLGASLRISDSLQDNRSRFMAEITRIRDIIMLSRAGSPVLFLLDELLSGTNSHDRLIGSSSIVQGLVAAGAIGLVTTHDLALAAIERDLGPRAANAHFEDAIINGEIVFDYVLRPGIVTRSNALALMRAVGLEV